MQSDTIYTTKMLEKTPFKDLAEILWYPGYVRGAPDLMVFVLPRVTHSNTRDAYRSRYRVIFIETDQDRRDAEDIITQPLVIDHATHKIRFPIDTINQRPSTAVFGEGSFCTITYPPASPNWPFVVITASGNDQSVGSDFARGRYAWEVFPTEQDAFNFCIEIGQYIRQINPATELAFMFGEDQKRDS